MTLEAEMPEPENHDDGHDHRDDHGRSRGDDHGRDGSGGRTRGRRRRSPWVTVPVGVVLGLLLIAVLTPLTVGARVWYQARQDERPRSDAIIVLGAAQYNGQPSPTLRWRLQHALDLYRAGVAPAIVTVGGKAPGDNYTEAGSGRTWLVEKGGVPAGRVVAVPLGRDTLGSMRAVGAEFDRRGWSSAVIVSDPWHGLRSKKMAADHGIEAAASPTRSGPSVQTRETQFDYIVRETGAYLSYVLLGKSVRVPDETIRRINIDPSRAPSPPVTDPPPSR
ncbi:YdcF family protein [Actinomadura sp. GC306]|uniref:YdcF family protein n=1 Tax=Actinomadura sp. GC306 TaxID=2530367 RepID=UPI0010517830|nr:YdcF family protein [Actinomadura sp. GC306]TDC63974.1 YdcF family protein [Actinomadura sp. GC306]